MIDALAPTIKSPSEVALSKQRSYPWHRVCLRGRSMRHSRILIYKHFHRSGEVLETFAQLGDMADSGPREMIAEERDPVSGKHIKHPHARIGSLLGVRIVDKLEARLQ